jgi:hypothetical protein
MLRKPFQLFSSRCMSKDGRTDGRTDWQAHLEKLIGTILQRFVKNAPTNYTVISPLVGALVFLNIKI